MYILAGCFLLIDSTAKLERVLPILAPPSSCMYDLSAKDCAACDEGYASGFQYKCHSCQGSDKWPAIGGAVAVLVVTISAVALILAYLVSVVERPIPERRGKWEIRALNFRDRLVRVIPLTAIKIVLVSWQIITQVKHVALYCQRKLQRYITGSTSFGKHKESGILVTN